MFARMFSNETAERQTGVVKLDDVTVDGLVQFLEFMYLGAMPFFNLLLFSGFVSCIYHACEVTWKQNSMLYTHVAPSCIALSSLWGLQTFFPYPAPA